MSRRDRALALVALLWLGALLAAAPAEAEPGPIEMVSKDAHEQADSASAPALSADGRFVAFVATIGGLQGVFRKDLATGELRPVAVGSAYREVPYEGPGVAAPDATDPSISADGRYISFTTSANLLPADETGSGGSDEDVYVADLNTTPPTYELASALDGSDEALSYEGTGGSSAAGRVALSADGREVVFVTNAPSNLMGLPGGTPADQVALRNLETRRTTLVSVERSSTTGTMEPGEPVAGGAVYKPKAGASLSGDGTTVAWLGKHLPEQVATLAGDGTELEYNEPLWRRVADGAFAPTRRIVGGSDPLAPGCPSGGSITEAACQGPFPRLGELAPTCGESGVAGWMPIPHVEEVPMLSSDGLTVALIGQPNAVSNLFVVDMQEGLDRRQALRQVTQGDPLRDGCESLAVANTVGSGPITDLAIAADADKIAFTTGRQQFPQSPPSLITAPPTRLGLAELYVLNLRTETIQRLTPRNRAEASTAKSGGLEGAVRPSLSADGSELAFASGASNLVPGDANGASDVFAISDPETVTTPGTVKISAPPSPAQAKRPWKLSASARSLPDGRVRIRATLPGAGRLSGTAKALVGSHLHHRTVAAARRDARREGLSLLDLKLGRHYRRLARQPGGVAATVMLQFRATGHRSLADRLQVSFRVHAKRTRTGGGKGR